jgi:hypothetical protein
MIAETPPPAASKINSISAFARCRLAAIARSAAVRRELIIVFVLMAVVYAHPALTWWRRWTLPGGPQGYAVFVVPIILAWLWIARYRVVVPEIDNLFERFVDTDVLRYLMEVEPEQPRRLRWLFGTGCIMTLATLWMREPSFTCLAFCVTVLGLVGYRQGTFAVRVLIFPLLLLFSMIPLPGILIDWFSWRVQAMFMAVAKNIVDLLGGTALRLPGGNGLLMQKSPGIMDGFVVFGGQHGNGFWVAGLFLLLTLAALSVVAAQLPRKIVSFLLAVLGISLLVGLRLALIGWMGLHDSDLGVVTAGLTLPGMLAIAIVCEIIVMKMLGCVELRPWVRLGRDRSAKRDDADRVPLHETPASVRSHTMRRLAITAGISVIITAVNLFQAHSPGLPVLPEHIDVWKQQMAKPLEYTSQRDRSPGLYRLYMADGRPDVHVCIARASTLNDFRAGVHYLMGPDGQVLPSQEGSISRKGDPHMIPVYTVQLCGEYGDSAYLLHWIQSPGGEPIKDVLGATDKIGTMLTTHSRVFICDIWIPISPGTEKLDYPSVLNLFADELSKQIRQMD